MHGRKQIVPSKRLGASDVTTNLHPFHAPLHLYHSSTFSSTSTFQTPPKSAPLSSMAPYLNSLSLTHPWCSPPSTSSSLPPLPSSNKLRGQCA